MFDHELFHQVQYRYNSVTSLTGFEMALREGGARLAEDCIEDFPNRYAGSAAVPFMNPTHALANIATANAEAYAAGLFWKYLTEQHSTRTSSADEPAVGFDAYCRVLESTATTRTTDPNASRVFFTPPSRAIRR